MTLEQKLLPVDIIDNGSSSKSTSTVEPSKVGPKQKEITSPEDQNDIAKWDALLKSHQLKFDKEYTPKSTAPEIASTIFSTYHNLLARFPFLEDYWKALSILEFKVSGIEKSINVLENSIAAHPHSIDLWSDYLTALVSQLKDSDPEKVEFIRKAYRKAIEMNGVHFTSHPIWDKAIEFETSVDSKSLLVLGLYKEVIRIPLYQYAQYYQQFLDVSGSFSAEQIIEKPDLDTYLAAYRKSLSEFTAEERSQCIADYAYKTFLKTQNEVNAKWAFESALLHQAFTLSNSSEVEKEEQSWISYLNYETERYKANPSEVYLISVMNLFERCLVPHCFNSKVWLKYISFLNKVEVEGSFDLAEEVYTRAAAVLPLEDNSTRFTYHKFLMKYAKFDEAVDYLLGLIKSFNGTIYLKQQYLETVDVLCQFLQKALEPVQFKHLISGLITDYFESNSPKRQSLEPTEGSHFLSDAAVQAFKILLNDEAIAVLSKSYLQNESDALTIRKFYNIHYNYACFKKSAFFWRFFIEYEGSHNYANFTSVVHQMKQKSQLPKAVLNALLDLSYDIASANFVTTGNFDFDDTILLTIDNDISNSLVENSAATSRLAHQNYIVQDMERAKLAKGANANTKQDFLRQVSSHAAHPGIVVEATPEVTNRIASLPWTSLTDPQLSVPPFPTFKNVEKASLAVNYPR